MKCHDVEKKLIFYLDNSLASADKEKIRVHLHACNMCRAKQDHLSNTLSYLDTMKTVKPKPFLYTRIKARMHDTPPVEQGFRLAPIRIAYIMVLGLVAGTLFSRLTIQSTSQPVSQYNLYDVFYDYRLEQIENKLLTD